MNSKDTRNKIMKEVKKAREQGRVMPDKHGHENQSKSEDETRQRKPVDKKFSNQVEELSDYLGKMSELQELSQSGTRTRRRQRRAIPLSERR
jgi:hypothetical protein